MWEKILQFFGRSSSSKVLLDKTILVIDDGIAERTLMTKVLTSRGCRIITAADGNAGIEKAGAQKPDLILLDFMMPGLNGKDVCRQLKSDEKTKHIPVVFLTGSPNVVECYDVGADYYLSKPISAKALIRQLELTFQELTA